MIPIKQNNYIQNLLDLYVYNLASIKDKHHWNVPYNLLIVLYQSQISL